MEDFACGFDIVILVVLEMYEEFQKLLPLPLSSQNPSGFLLFYTNLNLFSFRASLFEGIVKMSVFLKTCDYRWWLLLYIYIFCLCFVK